MLGARRVYHARSCQPRSFSESGTQCPRSHQWHPPPIVSVIEQEQLHFRSSFGIVDEPRSLVLHALSGWHSRRQEVFLEDDPERVEGRSRALTPRSGISSSLGFTTPEVRTSSIGGHRSRCSISTARSALRSRSSKRETDRLACVCCAPDEVPSITPSAVPASRGEPSSPPIAGRRPQPGAACPRGSAGRPA
jgi:hypothetical protein